MESDKSKGRRSVFKPHEYQKYAIDWVLSHKEAGLFLDMGLGKTVITLTAIEELIYDRFESSKVLVIAPPRVAESTWINEVKKWEHLSDLRIVYVSGSPERRKSILEGKFGEFDVYIISNSSVSWLCVFLKSLKVCNKVVTTCNKLVTFDTIVVDELSAFKSTSSERFRALKQLRKHVNRFIGLTGTPAPNNLIELWPQMYLIDMGKSLYNSVTRFRSTYFYPKRSNGYIVYEYGIRDGAEEAIYEAISESCVSMKAIDYLTMPDRIDINIPVKLSLQEKKIYDTLKKDYCIKASNDSEYVSAANAAVLSNKLLQLTQGAIYDDAREVQTFHNRKLDALEQIIEESNGKPLLLVYQYKHDLTRIMSRFGKDYRVVDYKTGENVINRWDNGEIDILCVHPSSCQYGLNLQSQSTIVWFALTWSLEAYQQTNARLWRQGQKNTVVIYHILCEGTIDYKAIEVLKGKETRQNALLEAIKVEGLKVKD